MQPIANRTVMLDYRQDIRKVLKGNQEGALCQGPKGTHDLASLIFVSFESTLGYN